MDIYSVKSITEADYGCEETFRSEPMACLLLVNDDTLERMSVEVPERVLSERGITEGRKVIFDKDGNPLKYIRVVAAVICRQINGETKIFATERGYGEFKDWWEFPGGKIEQGETPEQALEREIREELTAKIRVGKLIDTVEYDYPAFHLSMDCFRAEVVSGELLLKEAEAAKWLSKDELDSVKWLPADLDLVKTIKDALGGK